MVSIFEQINAQYYLPEMATCCGIKHSQIRRKEKTMSLHDQQPVYPEKWGWLIITFLALRAAAAAGFLLTGSDVARVAYAAPVVASMVALLLGIRGQVERTHYMSVLHGIIIGAWIYHVNLYGPLETLMWYAVPEIFWVGVQLYDSGSKKNWRRT